MAIGGSRRSDCLDWTEILAWCWSRPAIGREPGLCNWVPDGLTFNAWLVAELHRPTARRSLGGPELVGLIDQLIALHQAGLSSERVWRALNRNPPSTGAQLLVGAIRPGGNRSPAEQLIERAKVDPRVAWLALVFRVCDLSGCSAATPLRALATVVRFDQKCADEFRVALAGPRSTARVLAFLPALTIPLGRGPNPADWLILFQPPGLTLTSLGVGCWALGWLWHGAITRSHRLRQARTAVPDWLVLELIAAMLDGGLPFHPAQALILQALGWLAIRTKTGSTSRTGVDHGAPRRPGLPPGTARLLDLAQETGMPLAEALRLHGRGLAERRLTQQRERLARLPTWLLFPVTLCFLPGFALLGVGPIALSMLSNR
jgi:tight adherence protein B